MRKVSSRPSSAKNASGSATRRTTEQHVALVPLVARQLAGHRGIAAQDDHEAVDTLAGAGVHLVRHRRGADLARLEALGHQLVPAISRIVLAVEDGAAASCTNAVTTS